MRDTIDGTRGSRNGLRGPTGHAAFERLWGGPGSAEGRFCDPRGVDVAADGTVLVADFCNDRVQVFDATGRFLGAWSGYPDPDRPTRERPFMPADLAVAPDGSVVVADWRENRVLRFDRAGVLVSRWGGASNGRVEAVNTSIRLIARRSYGFHSRATDCPGAPHARRLVPAAPRQIGVCKPPWTFHSAGAAALNGQGPSAPCFHSLARSRVSSPRALPVLPAI